MARALNTKLVETAKPDPGRRIEIPDGALAGLYLVVQPTGAKSWAVRYRHDGKPTKLTLGPYPRLPLGDHKTLTSRIALADDYLALGNVDLVGERGDPGELTLVAVREQPDLPQHLCLRFPASPRSAWAARHVASISWLSK